MKFFISLAMILSVSLSLIPMPSQAQTFEYGGCYYREVSGENFPIYMDSYSHFVELTYNEALHSAQQGSYAGDIVIPSDFTFNGELYRVIGVGKEAFKYSNELGHIEWPNLSYGYNNEVHKFHIADCAFEGCPNVNLWPIYDSNSGETKLISIPSGVTIGEGAFMNSGLEELSSSCSIIYHRAFKDCKKLKKISIANNTNVDICMEAFSGCETLEAALISDVSDIGDKAFAGCINLKGNSERQDNSFGLILDKVEFIGERAFENCAFDYLYLGGSLRGVGAYAFRNCKGLKEIHFNANTFNSNNDFDKLSYTNLHITLPQTIFEGCSKLESAYIGRRIVEDWDGNILCNPFKGADLKDVSFEDFAIEVSFNGADFPNLKSVSARTTIPPSGAIFTTAQYNDVILYSPNDFSHIYATTDVWKNFSHTGSTSTSDISLIKHDGLYYAYMYHQYNFDSYDACVVRNIYGGGYSGDITIPETINAGNKTLHVTHIGENAFYDCVGLNTINLPHGVNILPYAFSYSGIKKIDLKGVAKIGIGAFAACDELEEVVLPESQEFTEEGSSYYLPVEIPDMAFDYCEKLSRINWPISCYIGCEAFSGCRSLPNSISFYQPQYEYSNEYHIDEEAFERCNIKDLELSFVTIITGDRPFSDNPLENITASTLSFYDPLHYNPTYYIAGNVTNLKSLTLNGSVYASPDFNWIAPTAEINKVIFNYTPESRYDKDASWLGSSWNVDSIVSYSTEPFVLSEFDSSQYSHIKVEVPESALQTYKYADVWREFLNMEGKDFAGTDNVFIDSDLNNAPIEIYNLNGMRVADSTSNLPSGLYILRQGNVVKKIVVN